MLSERAKEVTRREWRELGFFYDRDDQEKKWKVIGARAGLRKFASLVRQYASDLRNEAISEHEHYGPYMYLEVGTWDVPQITDHWIAGPLDKLLALASTIEETIANQAVGERISLRPLFAPNSPYDLELEMRPKDFDPVSEDPNFR